MDTLPSNLLNYFPINYDLKEQTEPHEQKSDKLSEEVGYCTVNIEISMRLYLKFIIRKI